MPLLGQARLLPRVRLRLGVQVRLRVRARLLAGVRLDIEQEDAAPLVDG